MTKYIIAALAVLVFATAYGQAAKEFVSADDRIAQGKVLAFDRRKGNCLACHLIEGGELAGNFGPPLVLMKVRYPDREKLRAQIWDASVRDRSTRMPPFGRHKILTEQEIDLVVDYVLTL
jgi:L-cysteine S-thiosulfotransferase